MSRRLIVILISAVVLVAGFYFYFFFGRTCCAPPDLIEEGMPYTRSAEEYQKLLELYEKTKAPLDEAGAFKKICALELASGRSLTALWKDENRAVFQLTPDPANMPDGPVVYFNGAGEQLLSIPLRPVLKNDTQAGFWNYQVTSLLKDLTRGKTLVCPGAFE